VSVPVDLERLGDEVRRFGSAAFVLTTSEDGRPHAVHVALALGADGVITAEAGNRTRANATARPLVSLVWAPIEALGYSLIVDGDAAVDGESFTITPTKAVLHRSTPPAGETAGACGSDCVPLSAPLSASGR
jgi:electron transfer flavoprotein alpha/beta subunit